MTAIPPNQVCYPTSNSTLEQILPPQPERAPSPVHPVLQEMAMNQQRASRSARPAPLPAFTFAPQGAGGQPSPSPTKSAFSDMPSSAGSAVGIGHRRGGSEFVGAAERRTTVGQLKSREARVSTTTSQWATSRPPASSVTGSVNLRHRDVGPHQSSCHLEDTRGIHPHNTLRGRTAILLPKTQSTTSVINSRWQSLTTVVAPSTREYAWTSTPRWIR